MTKRLPDIPLNDFEESSPSVRCDSRGSVLLQMIVVLAVITTVTTMSVMGIRSARASMRLQNSARVMAQNFEKARLDAIRRHVNTHVEFTGANTYEISMDFAGNGTPQTRGFTLDENIALSNADGSAVAADSYPYTDFDFRGRTYECSMLFRMKNERGEQAVVQVAGSGDITVNSAATMLPNVNYTTVNSSTDISAKTVLNGNNNPMNLSPCGTGGVGTGGGPVTPPSITCSAGTVTLSTGYFTVSRNGGSSQGVTVTVTGAGTVTAAADSNLSVTPASRSISSSGGGAASFSVSSVNKTRGTFPVKFYFAACSPATLYVKVTN